MGYAIDQRLTTATLRSTIAARRPFPGCVFRSDRRVQYAAGSHRRLLKEHGFVGPIRRRGDPYDNPHAESFMKTLKVEAVCATEYDSLEDVVTDLRGFIEDIYNAKRLHSALGYLSPDGYDEINARAWSKSAA